MSVPPASSARRCMGCHPTLARTEPDCSSADRKPCDMNGLYSFLDVARGAIAAPGWRPSPVPLVQPGACLQPSGLAQASQASAATSPSEPASRSVSSIEAMDLVEQFPCRALAQIYGRNPSNDRPIVPTPGTA